MPDFKPTPKDVVGQCGRAWRQRPVRIDVCLTFCTGGLAIASWFQRAGMPKVEVIGVPWTRRGKSRSTGFRIVGPPLQQWISTLFGASVAVVDDVFDSGTTFARAAEELAHCRAREFHFYAPYGKGDPERHPVLRSGGVHPKDLFVGSWLSVDTWIHFPGEPENE